MAPRTANEIAQARVAAVRDDPTARLPWHPTPSRAARLAMKLLRAG
ncbi:hypothetical protein [Mycobacterium intermedium]|nr:hypothetical protein [Mycobacterium intermedium]